MTVDRKKAIELAMQAGYKYIDHITFRGSYNKCTVPEKYEIDCLVRLCNLVLEEAVKVARTTNHHEATEFANGFNQAALDIERAIKELLK